MRPTYHRNFKPPFSKFVKKSTKALSLAIEDEVEIICETPEIGTQKVGDLVGIWVHKFRFNKQEYLIAYCPSTPEQAQEGISMELLRIDFYQVGPHENFYMGLKKYLKTRGGQ